MSEDKGKLTYTNEDGKRWLYIGHETNQCCDFRACEGCATRDICWQLIDELRVGDRVRVKGGGLGVVGFISPARYGVRHDGQNAGVLFAHAEGEFERVAND